MLPAMETLQPAPLSQAVFEPFGNVIEIGGNTPVAINSGNCQRYSDLARADVCASGAVGISLFAARCCELPLPLIMVERHPLGSQAFLPMGTDPFLVVVCPDNGGAPGAPLAFMTNGKQGVNYRRNTWHGVLTPVGRDALFAVVDYIGDKNNLQEFYFKVPPVIDLPDPAAPATVPQR